MVDIPGDATTTRSIGIGETVNDQLEVNGDTDWFRIQLTAGQQISVFANGITLADPIIRIRDASGNVLFQGDDWGDGLDAFVGFAATYSGTYFIDVGSAPNNQTGSYQLSVTNYTPPPIGTIDDIANQMTHGYWNGDAHHFDVSQSRTITVNLTALAADGAAVARQALALWTDIIGVSFIEVTTGGQIVFGQTNEGTGAFSTSVWANGITSSATVNVAPSRLSLHTYLHEIAHALGLGHSGDYNGGTAFSRFPYEAMWLNDGAAVSIMSYFDNGESSYYSGLGFTNNIIVTPQVADIIAMTDLYGVSTTTRTGDTTYGFNSTADRAVFSAVQFPNVAYTIFDSGGVDTLDYSGFFAAQRIDLNPEAFSNVGGSVGNVSIARGVLIENAIGGSGADTIIGNSSDNILSGRGGLDILAGGPGDDTFRDTKAGLNGDTITDFSPGDKIVISDAVLAGFNFSLAGNTLTFTGGSLTLSNVPSGTIVVTAAAGGGVELSLASIFAGVPHAGDFNGDGRDDILWRNGDGRLTDWVGQGAGGFTPNFANADHNAGNDWQVFGTGDFNHDGRDDIIWRNVVTGEVTDWLAQANGSFASNFGNAYYQVDLAWQIVGVGDFNGDGWDDLLWRDNSGRVTDWLGQGAGGFTPNFANADHNAGLDWHVVGIGDFNHDGRDDILWRNDNGDVTNWLGQLNGGFASNFGNAFYQVSTNWQVAGIGDFNGDGWDDILWRDGTGRVTDWLGQGNGGFTPNFANADHNAGLEWQIVSVGDFNLDGRGDILWRNDNGDVTNWLGQANGGFLSNFGNAYYQVDLSWQVQPNPAGTGFWDY